MSPTRGLLSRQIRLKRPVRVALVVFLALVAFGVAFMVWVVGRGGRDYTGDLALLLPEETPAYFVLRDLSTLLDRLEGSGLYRRCAENPEAIFSTSKSLKKLVKNADTTASRTELILGRRFVRRWLGKEVVVAIAPSGKGSVPSGLLVLARTDIGFEEALAELVAQIWTDARLTSLEYRGMRINRFEAAKAKRAFTYLRFGKTIVFSLRSPEWDYLQSVVDRRLDEPKNTFAASRLYRDHSDAIPRFGEGLYGLISTEDALAQLRVIPGASMEDYLSDSDWDSLSALAKMYPEMTLRLEARDKVALSLEAFPGFDRSQDAASGVGRHLEEAIRTLPTDTLIFVGVARTEVGLSLWNWFESIDPQSKLFDSVVNLRSQLSAFESRQFIRDFVRAADPALWLAWTRLSRGFALPSVGAEIAAARSGEDSAELLSRHALALGVTLEEAKNGIADFPTLLGPFRLEESPQLLKASLNSPAGDALTSTSLASAPLLLELNGTPDRNTIFLFYANFEVAARTVSEESFVRSAGAKQFAWFKGLGPLRGMVGRLEQIERGGRSLELLIPIN